MPDLQARILEEGIGFEPDLVIVYGLVVFLLRLVLVGWWASLASWFVGCISRTSIAGLRICHWEEKETVRSWTSCPRVFVSWGISSYHWEEIVSRTLSME
jgi:hypothetical protein